MRFQSYALPDLLVCREQDGQRSTAVLPPYRRITAEAAAAQATSLAPTRPPPYPGRQRAPPATARAVGSAARPAVVTSGFGTTPHSSVVAARGATWLQAARLQAARLTVRRLHEARSDILTPLLIHDYPSLSTDPQCDPGTRCSPAVCDIDGMD
jgi:hypothetical protein